MKLSRRQAVAVAVVVALALLAAVLANNNPPRLTPRGFIAPSPIAGSKGYIGIPYARGDRFNVLPIGGDVGAVGTLGSGATTGGSSEDLRFRADHTGTMNGFTTYFIDAGYTGLHQAIYCKAANYASPASTEYWNYACGDGGNITAKLYADSGGQPTGSPLATATMNAPLTDGCATPGPYLGYHYGQVGWTAANSGSTRFGYTDTPTCTPDGGVTDFQGHTGTSAYTTADRLAKLYKTMTFATGYSVTSGTVYHLVFANASTDVESNFISFDWFGIRQGTGVKLAQDTDALPLDDWAVAIKTGADARHTSSVSTACWDGDGSWDFGTASHSARWDPSTCGYASHYESYSPPVGLNWADGHHQGSAYYEAHGTYLSYVLGGSGCTSTMLNDTTKVIRQLHTVTAAEAAQGNINTLRTKIIMGQSVTATAEVKVRNMSTMAVLASGTQSVASLGNNPKASGGGAGQNPNFISISVTPFSVTTGMQIGFEIRASAITGAVTSGGCSALEGIEAPILVDGVDEGFWTGSEIHDPGHVEFCPTGPTNTCNTSGIANRDIYWLMLTDVTTGATTTTAGSTTTSTSTTTTTIPGAYPNNASVAGTPADCVGGTRYEAEAMTLESGTLPPTGGSPANRREWAASSAAELRYPPGSTLAAGTYVFHYRYSTTGSSSVVRYQYADGAYVNQTFPGTSGNWGTYNTPAYTLAAGGVDYEFIGGYSTGGAMFLDSVDVCPYPYTATTTTTTTSSTTTTTAPGTTTTTFPPVSPLTACSPGNRTEAEVWTKIGATGSSGTGYETHSASGTGYSFSVTPTATGTATLTFRVRNGTGSSATRTLYWSADLIHVQSQTVTIPGTTAAWQDVTVSLGTANAGIALSISPSWDSGNTGTVSFDYADTCGPAFLVIAGACLPGSLLSTSSATATTGPSAALIDGDESTPWTAATQNGESITVTLTASSTLSRVTMHWVTNRAAAAFTVSVYSGTAGTGTLVSTVKAKNYRSNTPCWTSPRFGVTARSIVVSFTAMEPAAGTFAPSIYEVGLS